MNLFHHRTIDGRKIRQPTHDYFSGPPWIFNAKPTILFSGSPLSGTVKLLAREYGQAKDVAVRIIVCSSAGSNFWSFAIADI